MAVFVVPGAPTLAGRAGRWKGRRRGWVIVLRGMVSPKARRGAAFSGANALSLSRLALAPLCVLAILNHTWPAALLFFAAAVATDFADGPVARRRGEVTALGGFLDHASDAVFVSSSLAALAWEGVVPVLLPVCVALAFLQYALDSRVIAGRPLRASALGRYNGIAYFVVLGIPVVRNGLGLGTPGDGWVWILAWIVVVSTFVSMADRLVAFTRRGGPGGAPS